MSTMGSAKTAAAADSLGFDGGLTLSCQCADRKKAAAWYEKILGFKLLYDVAEIGWCELSTAVSKVNIGLSEVEKPRVGAGPVPTFGVTDLDSARAKLEKQGVRFDGATREIPGMVKLATFFDLDGNALMLFQDLQKS
ncbi:MAG: VOC family protein [Phycisphaeraceae bacterium]|nr:VOC family protein [Phycisphaeraceae bacterium]